LKLRSNFETGSTTCAKITNLFIMHSIPNHRGFFVLVTVFTLCPIPSNRVCFVLNPLRLSLMCAIPLAAVFNSCSTLLFWFIISSTYNNLVYSVFHLIILLHYLFHLIFLVYHVILPYLPCLLWVLPVTWPPNTSPRT